MTKQQILKLNEELKYAVMKTTNKDLTALGGKIPLILIYVASRRLKNAKDIVLKMGKYFSLEGNKFYKAFLNKELKKYFNNKYKQTNENIEELNEEIIKAVKNFSKYIRKNPKTNIANFLMFILGAYLGSGGIDGDGGIPDLDLEIFGIENHRSIFTHSVIAGIIIETLILFSIIAIDMIYDKLPKEHLEIWDLIHEKKDDFLFNFTTGVSAGLAYHFTIDATIDGMGTYKDLPFSAPREVHQFIMGANAFIEGLDAYYKKFDYKIIKNLFILFKSKFNKKDSNETKIRLNYRRS